MADRRIEKTLSNIDKCFYELLKEKDLHHITVKDICDKANINRSTFYTHYQDYYDYLEYLEMDMAKRFLEAMSKYRYDMDFEEVTDALFHCIKENKDLFYFMFHDKSTRKGIQFILDSLKSIVIPIWRKESNISSEQADLLFIYVTAGASELLRTWYNSDFSIDENIMKPLFQNVIKYGLYDFVYTK
ncbi:TetR/AcrR family transcriptional regulator [Aminipila luticellarii]|uniref:TetR family transcriptional regulator n=1 Tax=Aminipila luticellarii TaxID=2507160 RepID=A0A410PX81_9FIRM|nr:TetR/AcrR family transcriptional regulator C-terminal domain-containing protein [Aminipila luticellarii]QAT43557.1 TetR family transcriptional regulator [Aminipila luticellarii]